MSGLGGLLGGGASGAAGGAMAGGPYGAAIGGGLGLAGGLLGLIGGGDGGAKAARKVLGFYAKRTKQATNMYRAAGEADIQKMAESYEASKGNALASLAGRGLLATTIVPSIVSGIDRQRISAVNAARAGIAREAAQIYSATSGQQGAALAGIASAQQGTGGGDLSGVGALLGRLGAGFAATQAPQVVPSQYGPFSGGYKFPAAQGVPNYYRVPTMN